MNQNKSEIEYSDRQTICLWLAAPLFMLFVLHFIPSADTVVKVSTFLIGIPIIGLISTSTAKNLSFLYNWDSRKSVIRTIVIVLLVPAIMLAAYYLHRNSYISYISSNNFETFRITIDIERTGGKGSIGGEWSYKHYINNTSFQNGDIVKINVKEPFTITSSFTEHDSINDVGTKTSKKFNFATIGNSQKTITITNDVKVSENGGRRNSNSYAKFSTKYIISKVNMPATTKTIKVLPVYFSFPDVYFFTGNQTETAVLWGILLAGIGSVVYVVFVFYASRKRELQLEAERKAEEERIFQAGKRAFISSLGGKLLQDAAGVPAHITYKNGKPVDNNNAEFGTFTVYLSNSGKCFHRCKGCCSAYRPTHLFTATQYYKPCSKCSATHYSIPDWHLKYMELKKEAKKYGIEE